MEPISSILVMKTLDGLSARSTVTSQNIANAGTKGYRPLRVSFEKALAAAVKTGVSTFSGVTPNIQSDPLLDGQNQGVRLDLELATAASTSGRYGALVEVLSRQLQLDSIAITGNR